MSLDQARLQDFLGKMVGDMGAIMTGALVVIGDKLGLYKGLAELGPASSEALAKATNTNERYVREWLAAQAAAGYVEYDAAMNTYRMTPEQQITLADDSGPLFMAGAFELFSAAYIDEPKITEAFRTGKGVGWHEHHPCLFRGTERFFRPGYMRHLMQDWLPALDGVTDKLERGAEVADIGCGHGASTILMAATYPNSTFHGFDYHESSIERARQAAKDAGVAQNTDFQMASAKDYPGSGFDLIAFFDCLHDMGDPVGAAAHARKALKADGTALIVEPFANDTVAENLNPIGRMFYAASTMFCTPASLSQEIGLGLGAQAGEKKLREVVTAGGFTRFRRATETPFNLVLEARP